MKYMNLTLNKIVFILMIGDRSGGEASARERASKKNKHKKSSEQGEGERARASAYIPPFVGEPRLARRGEATISCMYVFACNCMCIYMHAFLRSARATEQPSDRRYERSTKPPRDQAIKRPSDQAIKQASKQVSKRERKRATTVRGVCACV